ncbi:type II toxin-antitoxin system RelE/ParE family toxin [Aurantimonas sp. MSK8Z-1]|uniref:type II toxin-antitoxin system RelE/ParE family toxin n=1 Tax=Mangrovibrevibacter kandeliae TaxID=2968473 RepID=UPI002117F325|nr:type II toxin-antitoxin system RelE/ParE family toxin [Aurantimonas sp. MSK8Z-1]MCW4113390.1 type II toxin-antitoxin system RelE/ParE family toxin [Aurantimonas sp. MSK8Z-1]
MRLRYTRTALRQIEQALSFISERSPQGAAGLARRIASALAVVLDHPLVAQATSRPDVRRLVLSPYPYVVFYRVAATEIVILRFRHTARKPLPDG